MTDFLQKLLNGQKVEWKKLGEVTQYEQPTKYLVKTQDYNDKFAIPVLTAGKTFILGYTDETDGIYKGSQNPVIIFDDFTTANKWVDFDFKAKSSAMKMITSSDDNKFILKYIYYWLNTLPSELIDGDHKRQWISNFCNKELPLPPLHIQKEIVDILDTLTIHTAELTAELTARRKQYNHYREKLLTFGAGVEWKKLGEVCELKRGTTITEKTKTDGDIPVISGGQKPAYYNGEYNRDGETITVAGSGAYAGHLMYWNEPIFVSDAFSVKPNLDLLNTRYVYHFLINNQSWIYNLKKGSGVPHVYPKDLATLPIPLPPLAVQKEIVEILDTLTTHTAELTARRKQYEHYRNQLLNFEKPPYASKPF